MPIAASSGLSDNIVRLESLIKASTTFVGSGGEVFVYECENADYSRPAAVIREDSGMDVHRGGMLLGVLNILFEADVDPEAENARDAGISFRNWLGNILQEMRAASDLGEYLILQDRGGMKIARAPQRSAQNDPRGDFYDCLVSVQVGLR